MTITEVDPSTYGVNYFNNVKRILEVGVGCDGSSAINPVLNPDLYVITDVQPTCYAPRAANFDSHTLLSWKETDLRNLRRMYADGTELPFRDKAFDAVFASNVIGDPSISPWTKIRIIKEALRVTKSIEDLGAAALWLVEYNTPEIARSFMQNLVNSEHGQTLSVKKASVKVTGTMRDSLYSSRNYPISVGLWTGCDIWQIVTA